MPPIPPIFPFLFIFFFFFNFNNAKLPVAIIHVIWNRVTSHHNPLPPFPPPSPPPQHVSEEWDNPTLSLKWQKKRLLFRSDCVERFNTCFPIWSAIRNEWKRPAVFWFRHSDSKINVFILWRLVSWWNVKWRYVGMLRSITFLCFFSFRLLSSTGNRISNNK